VHREIWESTKHLLVDGGELRKTFSASSTFLNDLNYNVCVYCTVPIIYNTVFASQSVCYFTLQRPVKIVVENNHCLLRAP
jgi:hypothetical protein